MKKILFILTLLSLIKVSAQVDYSYTTSGEYFSKAYEYLEVKDYLNAFKFFDRIDKSDTLYELAQFNKLIAQYTSKYYKESLKTAEKLISSESGYSPEAYFYMIKSQIDLKSYDDALKSIFRGSECFPLQSFRFEQLKAMMLKQKILEQ